MEEDAAGTERQVMLLIGNQRTTELLKYSTRRDIDIGPYDDIKITVKRQGNFTIVAVTIGERLGLGTSKRTTSTVVRDPETGKLERGPGDNEHETVGETIALWNALDDLYVSPFTGE